MAGRDRIIDPATRDYVKNSTGGYETTDTIGTKFYHQIAGKRGHYWGDRNHGSDLHHVKDHGSGEVGLAFAENAVKTACAKLIEDGEARDLRVVATAVNGRVSVDASIVDIQGAEVAVDGVTPFQG